MESCEEIYRLNEPGRFPEGYFGHFSQWLRKRRDLFLVAQLDGRIRACGGLNIDKRAPRIQAATLNFGMVHPEYHGQGFGTALLLARLASLPEPASRWAISISTTGGSDGFYRRFGFRRLGRFKAMHETVEFEHYYVVVSKDQWHTCRARLEHARIELDTVDVAIPVLLPGIDVDLMTSADDKKPA